MNSETYARCLTHARRVCPTDPALEPCDLVQMAWLQSRAWLDLGRPLAEQLSYLFTAINHLAISARRGYRWRGIAGMVPLEEWYDSGARFEDGVLDGLVLAPYFALAATDPMLLAVLLLALGFDQRETAARLGCKRATVGTRVWRWHQAHTETQA